jgi:hypothetical protein
MHVLPLLCEKHALLHGDRHACGAGSIPGWGNDRWGPDTACCAVVLLQVLLECMVEEYRCLRKAASIGRSADGALDSPRDSSDSKIKAS